MRFNPQNGPASENDGTYCAFRVTLRDGSTYAIDLCNAQYQTTTVLEHEHAIFPWDAYLERLSVSESDLLDTKPALSTASTVCCTETYLIPSGRLEDMEASIYLREDVQVSTEAFTWSCYRNALLDWEGACGMSTVKLLSLPRDHYESAIGILKRHQQRRFVTMRCVLDNGEMTKLLRHFASKHAMIVARAKAAEASEGTES